MRVEQYGEMTTLVVSRRNLLSLLAKLDGNPPGSACTLGAPAAYGAFFITAEEDDEHYSHPDRLRDVGSSEAGAMHPDTERAIRP